MKYQVRIKDTMSDRPASELFDTIEEAEKKLGEVRENIKSKWATPDTNAAYIFINHADEPKPRTSSAVKNRYNKKNYGDILVRLPKDLVNDFKCRCAEKNVSQAQVIRTAIEDFMSDKEQE